MKREMRRRDFLAVVSASVAVSSSVVEPAEKQPAPNGNSARSRCVVDAHAHLKHGDVARTEYSPDVIVDVMNKVGIDRSIVFAMSTTTKQSIEMAAAAVRKYPDRLIPYVYALPHYERPVIEEIADALRGGVFRGIKIHAGECTLAEYVVDPVLKIAGQYGAPCLIDCGGNYAAAKRMAQSFPETKLLIAHMGRYLSTDKRLIDQFISLAEDHGNVLLDVSGVALVDKIAEAVRRIGSARLIWGTDGPHNKPDVTTFARGELDKIRALHLNEQDQDNLLGQSILRLLGL